MADDFFVGWARTPLRVVRFVAITTAALLVAVDAVALVLYRAQERRASGDWGVGEAAYDGVLIARPYPMVLVPASPRVPAHAVLLVSEGKHGAPEGLERLDGKTVTAAGYPLLRDGLTVLQLEGVPHETAKALPPLAPAIDMGRRTLTGEIVDSKCYLGAMIPGEGKVHQECAALCLLGDIPSLFITRDAAGHITYRLLADETGGPMPAEAADHAGQFITLTGTITHRDGIDIFSVPRTSLD
ncbi:MAG TPA: hypothetical protein VL993_08855 [Stellaceae bacterium]|nr:hypothetical protein [Stellaceae bacterium]